MFIFSSKFFFSPRYSLFLFPCYSSSFLVIKFKNDYFNGVYQFCFFAFGLYGSG